MQSSKIKITVKKSKFWILTCTFAFFIFNFALPVHAETSRVEGYAWSANVGWVSFNCSNNNSCSSANYGVNLDRDTGALSGYAWNSGLGWISFNAGDVSGCPTSPCAPKLVDDTVTGWAKVLSGSSAQGWEGWVHLSDANYGVSFDGTKFTGYSWSDQVLGWMSWNPSKGPGVFSVSQVNITAGVVFGGGGSKVNIDSDTCTLSSCSFPYDQNATIDLVATAGPGYVFSNWSGANANECGTITSRFCNNINLTTNKEIKATFRTANCPTDGPGVCPACNDDIDNDLDNKFDYPEDPECLSLNGTSELAAAGPACDDCLDNDGDGKIDWLNDSGCSDNPQDNNEANALLTVSLVFERQPNKGSVISASPGINCGTDCTETYLNDESVKLSALPGNNTVFQKWTGSCTGTNPVCTLEMSASGAATAHFGDAPVILPQCSDGLDNDNDGKLDLDDPGCDSADDDDERDQTLGCPAAGPGICAQCNDGVDNDGDGFTDSPNDQDCSSLSDDNESETGANCPADGPGVCPACNDGVDNDNDGKTDYPADLGCFNRADSNETNPVIQGNCPADGPGLCPACNDGVDNDNDGFVDWKGWDSDKDNIIDIPRDSSCQGEPNKNSETGGIDVIEI